MTLAPRVRSDKAHLIPAAVHVDGTARIQTVERRSSPRFYAVIEELMKLTGVPVVLNTSFNKQEPIVARPEEAVSCFPTMCAIPGSPPPAVLRERRWREHCWTHGDSKGCALNRRPVC